MHREIWARLRLVSCLGSVLLVFVAALLTGCSVATPVATPSAPTATPTAGPPTITPTMTMVPTSTPYPTATPLPTPTPLPLALSVSVSSTAVLQGQTVELVVETNLACAVSARLGEQAVLLADLAGHIQWAVVGVSAMQDPGALPLVVSATTASGQSATVRTSVQIVSADYGFYRLELTEEQQAIVAAEKVEEEKLVDEITSLFTLQPLWYDAFTRPWDGPVTSEFGTRRDYGVYEGYHTGLDIDGVTGDPIISSAPGRVVLSKKLAVRGNTVIIDHGAGIYSAYCHLDQLDAAIDDLVAQGEQIGLMGSTGLSTGSHLHWEVRAQGVPVSPQAWLDSATTPPMGELDQ